MKRTLASLVIGLSFLMGATTSAWAQDFYKGFRAYDSGDYATALKEWRPLAEQGDVMAQDSLGFMLKNSEGVVQNYKEAGKWFRLAAEQGLAEAQFYLGLMLSNGKGVVQNYKEAVKWYRSAAEQGLADAHNNLGAMYWRGEGVIQDNVMAHMWLNIGASNGSTEAAKNRDIVASHMTAADISRAQQLARECVAKNYKGC
jgi:TPR repeat protein